MAINNELVAKSGTSRWDCRALFVFTLMTNSERSRKSPFSIHQLTSIKQGEMKCGKHEHEVTKKPHDVTVTSCKTMTISIITLRSFRQPRSLRHVINVDRVITDYDDDDGRID